MRRYAVCKIIGPDCTISTRLRVRISHICLRSGQVTQRPYNHIFQRLTSQPPESTTSVENTGYGYSDGFGSASLTRRRESSHLPRRAVRSQIGSIELFSGLRCRWEQSSDHGCASQNRQDHSPLESAQLGLPNTPADRLGSNHSQL